MNNQVIIFDTTLRDGEQALSASLTVKEKLQIAYALERLGVDIIEAGFPVSSPGDFESVQTIAKNIKNSRVCALSRAVAKDIDAAAEALKVAEAFRIHTFISTSTIHVQDKLRRSYDDVVEMAVKAVKHARQYTDDVGSLVKMLAAHLSITCAVWSKPRSMPVRVPSIFQIRSATQYRANLAALFKRCLTECPISIKRSSPCIVMTT